MFETIVTALSTYWQEALLGGIILVTTIIGLVGFLKKIMFNKITNKLVRKILLFFTSILLAFPAVAVYLWAEGFGFDLYYWQVAAVAVCTVVVYALYENTGARDFKEFIEEKTLGKLLEALRIVIAEGKSNKELQKTIKDINKANKQVIKDMLKASEITESVEKKDLKNL